MSGMTAPPFVPRTDTPRPSPHQEAILAAVRDTSDNLIIQAAAGSGKTTTLRLICEQVPPNLRVLAVCFNRSIAQEFKRKLPPHVDARTLHSVGLGICQKAQGKVKIDDYKTRNIIEAYAKRHVRFDNGKSEAAWQISMARLISVGLATMADLHSAFDLERLCDHYDINLKGDSWRHVAEIVALCRADRTTVGFDDMLDHPIHHDYPFPKFDLVLVDEAQDLNAQQLEFVERLGAGGRIIAVGDRNQAIYGFRGANHLAMDELQRQFRCRELPLSVCYRCGTEIIREAQAVVGPDAIQAAPGAQEGMVLRQEPKQRDESLANLQDGDLVVCRVNKHLVSPCFELIRRGQKAIIRGRDIGKGLATLVNRHTKKKSVNDLPSVLDSVLKWKDKRVAELNQRNRVEQAQGVEDQVDTLLAIAENVDSVPALLTAIQTIFSDESAGVVFSSIHRAKGLEADCVVYFAPELVPHPMAKTPEAVQQERNLDYVARTRARHALIYQPLPKGD